MSFWTELRRRNVVRVAIAYVILSWLLLQVGDLLFDLMGLPDWALRIVLGIVVLGFIPALLFSWIYELTPEGLKLESEVDREASIAPRTGRRLDVTIVVMLAVAIGLFGADRLGLFGASPVKDTTPEPVADAKPASRNGAEIPEPAEDKVAIAVLPFANLSGSDEALPFTNGLHDDLLTQLARIDGLKVISRTSVLEYRGTTKNVRTIGSELGVTHLVEGGVQRDGNRVRINAQLIDSRTDEHLWADTFDRELTVGNIFEMQSEIAGQITSALHVNLGGEKRPDFERPTDDLAAWEAYMQGRAELDASDYLVDTLRETQKHFEEAIRLDPGFAHAHARLALAKDLEFWFGGRNTRLREEALRHAQRALELEPELPEGKQALAAVYYHGYLDYDRALDMLAQAEEAMAGEVWFLITKAATLRRMGRFEDAIPVFEAALELNPRAPQAYTDLATSYQSVGRFDAARAVARRLESLDLPTHFAAFKQSQIDWEQYGDGTTLAGAVERFGPVDHDGAWVLLSQVAPALWSTGGNAAVNAYLDALEVAGKRTELSIPIVRTRYAPPSEALTAAVEEELAVLQARVIGGDQEPDLRLQIAEALIYLRRDKEARDVLESMMADPATARDRLEGPWRLGRSAQLYMRLGDPDRAIEALAAALAPHPRFSLRSYMAHPGMDALEDHPGFDALVERYGWTPEDRTVGLLL
ncbi:MAG: tetratricopeptide repeat protein [Xanthomonadales bacterium]|nr:tetratricopeptide repeat protein [Xanthomonadales bacterium]